MSLTFFGIIFFLRNALVDFSFPFMSLFLGVILISLFSRRFEIFILLLLIITSTVFAVWEFPGIPIMVGDLNVSDMLILMLLVGRLLKRVTTKVVIIPKPLGPPILAFILVAALTFTYSIISTNVSIARAGMDLRVMFHLALFFLLYYYVRSHKQLKTLLLGIGIIAGILATMQLIQWVVGVENDILGVRLEQLTTQGHQYEDVARVMLPGTPVILFTLNTILAIFVFTRLKLKWRMILLFAIALLATGMISTFSRALWIAVLAAVAIILFSAKKRKTSYPRVITLAVGTVLIIMLLLQTSIFKSFSVKDAIFSRTMSIVNLRENIKNDTLLIRLIESRYAWEKIVENPLLGIGFGTSYRPNIFGNVDYERRTDGTFVHNGYLSIQLKMGLLGTLAFIWMYSAFFRRIRRNWRKVRDPLYQATVLGIAVSMVGVLIFSITSPAPIMQIYWVAVIGIGFGIVEKIFQLEGIA